MLALDASGRRCTSVLPSAGVPGAAAAGDGDGSGRPILVLLPRLGRHCTVRWSRGLIPEPRPHSSPPLHVRGRESLRHLKQCDSSTMSRDGMCCR